MAPEYLAFSQMVEKADVHSFGVLLLKISRADRTMEVKTPKYTDNIDGLLENVGSKSVSIDIIPSPKLV